MANSIIEMSSFSLKIGGRTVLNEISLEIEEGQYVAIVGQNGAGKTTLLKCLNRIHTGGSGEIRIAGRLLGQYSQKKLAQLVSYVPQADGRSAPFTVYEFVMMGRYPYLNAFSSPSEKDVAAVHDALALTGTSEFAERLLGTLSGGERQKVFIAAALAQEAKILLLDEPTTFLDPKHEADVQRLLARANRERAVTIISVTHDINSAVLTSQRILALKNGEVAFWGGVEELMDNETLERIYEKSFLFGRHPRTGQTIVTQEVP